MPSTLGTPLPRQPYGRMYFYIAALTGALSAIGWIRGSYGWGLPAFFVGLAVFFYFWPYLLPRGKEFVQVDDQGVIVQTGKGLERAPWSELARVRIVTTAEGPWAEDVYFVLETVDGKGCVVPHDAAVRTKLLEEIQSRCPGVDDKRVVEAMGSTSNASFVIWEKRAGATQGKSG